MASYFSFIEIPREFRLFKSVLRIILEVKKNKKTFFYIRLLRERFTNFIASSTESANAVKCPIFLPIRGSAFPYKFSFTFGNSNAFAKFGSPFSQISPSRLTIAHGLRTRLNQAVNRKQLLTVVQIAM
jgi:hypothetical protein